MYKPKRDSKEQVIAALRDLMHLGPNDPAPKPPPLPAAEKKDDKKSDEKKADDVKTKLVGTWQVESDGKGLPKAPAADAHNVAERATKRTENRSITRFIGWRLKPPSPELASENERARARGPGP